MSESPEPNGLARIARELSDSVGGLSFSEPVYAVYNPLDYAWNMHREYIERYGTGRKQVLFVGMNPGPWGMAQTGVPFGEVAAVRDWLGLTASVDRPEVEHPSRPVEGLSCKRSEVSGRRLWGLFSERFGNPDAFFADHFVHNYCPLLFLEESGRNRTPDKLRSHERQSLLDACDTALRKLVDMTQPKYVVGIGAFAAAAARRALKPLEGDFALRIVQILHPSPASPKANRGWAEQVAGVLEETGIW